MSPGSNQPDSFAEIRRSHQAREILSILEEWREANDQLFYEYLGKIGLGIAYTELYDLFGKLEREALIITENVNRYRVIRATRAGNEVACNRAKIEWIAKVEPDQ